MRYPYERFLNFLITRKLDVNECLGRIDLPEVGDMGLADRKERIRETAPPALLRYLKQSRNDRALVFRDGILDWSETQGFRELWERQKEFGRKIVPAVETASNLFLNPNSRTVLGTMLLAETSTEEITEVIREQFSVQIQLEVIQQFTSLFWDVPLMGRCDWEDFLPMLDDDQRQILALGMRGLASDDIRYAIGSEAPSKPKDVLQDILTHAHHQFRQAMTSANPMSSGAFRWADLATKVANAMSGSRGGGGGFGDDDSAPPPREGAASMFSVVVEPPDIVTLDDLEGEIGRTKSAIDQAMEDQAS